MSPCAVCCWFISGRIQSLQKLPPIDLVGSISAIIGCVPHACGHDPLVLLMQNVSGHDHEYDLVQMNFQCGHGYAHVRSFSLQHVTTCEARE